MKILGIDLNVYVSVYFLFTLLESPAIYGGDDKNNRGLLL
jgi:hypothetical protein